MTMKLAAAYRHPLMKFSSGRPHQWLTRFLRKMKASVEEIYTKEKIENTIRTLSFFFLIKYEHSLKFLLIHFFSLFASFSLTLLTCYI